jgi:hypothetical protein
MKLKLATLSVIALVVGVCNLGNADAKPQPCPGNSCHSTTTTTTTTVAPTTTTPTTTVPTSGGHAYLPFGPKQIPYTEYGKTPFTGGYTNASTLSTLSQRVQAARAAHFPLIIKLAPAHAAMLSPTTGCFDINLWKASVSQLFSFDLAPYVADGTVAGAELVNEPHAKDWCTNNDTTRVSKADLEEMGRFVKANWPTLPVGGGRSDYMLANAPWQYIDFGHSQYHMRKGDVTTWVNQTVSESQAAGVQLLISLDYLVGEVGDTPMTADELRTKGIALATSPYSCLMSGYLWDNTYNAGAGIMEAFSAIAAVANSHPAPPCYVGAVKVRP